VEEAAASEVNSEPQTQDPHWIAAIVSQAARGVLLVVVLLAIHTLVLWRFRDVPYYWDALGYVFPHSLDIYRSGLNPILTRYDVGHPTLYYFLTAIIMKIAGVSPLAGHLATWLFSSIFVLFAYLTGRDLGLNRFAAIGATATILSFPLVFASLLQMQLDYPMTAMQLAAIWCWAKRRWGWYFLFGGMACLLKLYGFLFVPPLLFGCFLASGRSWRNGERSRFLTDLLATASPALWYVGYILVCRAVRGPGLTIQHVSGNTLVKFWHPEELQHNAAVAWTVLFRYPMIDALLFGFLAFAFVAGVALRWRPRHGTARWNPARGRLIVGLALVPLALNVAFLQLTGLCARYNLLLVASLTLGIYVVVDHLVVRRKWMLGVGSVVAVTLNVILWHPENAGGLAWLRRAPIRHSSMYEIDLRFLDAVELTRWGAAQYELRASGDEANVALISHWPMSVAFYEPGIGYTDRALRCGNARDWSDVRRLISEDPQRTTFYVLALQPIGDRLDPVGAREAGFELVRETTKGEITGRLYRWQRPSDARAWSSPDADSLPIRVARARLRARGAATFASATSLPSRCRSIASSKSTTAVARLGDPTASGPIRARVLARHPATTSPRLKSARCRPVRSRYSPTSRPPALGGLAIRMPIMPAAP
jgi:hypothetical protein